MSADPVTKVEQAVAELAEAAPALLEACTDPEAIDMADLFARVQDARKALMDTERLIEDTCARAMLGDHAETTTLRVERYRSTERKSWDHEAWQRDVRNKVLRAVGLAGAQGVLTADGEVLPPETLYAALERVQAAHGSAGPRTRALRELGLDARDYCESSPGAYHVRVTRMADETAKGDETDAA